MALQWDEDKVNRVVDKALKDSAVCAESRSGQARPSTSSLFVGAWRLHTGAVVPSVEEMLLREDPDVRGPERVVVPVSEGIEFPVTP